MTITHALKSKIVFLNYLIWDPDSEECSGKYILFSQDYQGIMFHLSHLRGDARCRRYADFISCSGWWTDNSLLRSAGYLLLVLRRIRGERDIDYIVCYDPLLCGLAGCVLKVFTQAKLVVEVNGTHFYGYSDADNIFRKFKLRMRKLIVGFVLRQADGVKFLNQYIGKTYQQLFPITAQIWIGGGDYVAIDQFKSSGESKDFILFVGGPFFIKGVDILIDAFLQISPKFPELKLVVVGFDCNREDFEKLARGHENIVFKGGVPHREVRQYFECCRLFVLPSRTEAMGRVLLEAMACGKPVVGSNVEGIPDVVEHGVNGLLFESESSKDLAEKMSLLLTDEQLVRRLVSSAMETVQRYSPKSYYAGYRNFLHQVSL